MKASPPSPKQAATWPGAFAAYGSAYKLLKANPQPAVFYVLVIAIFDIVINLAVTGSLKVSDSPHDATQLALWGGLINLLMLPYSIRYPLALVRKRKTSISQLLRPNLKTYFNLLLGVILVIVLIVCGAIAFLIPLIWVIPWCSLLLFAIVDLDNDPLLALGEARRLAANNKEKLWLIVLVSILPVLASSILGYIPVVGALAAPFVYLWTTTATALLYVWLSKHVTDEPA